MTIGELAAIRAIVAVHARHNRPKLLAALDAELERERAQSTEEEAIMGTQIKTTPRSRTWRSGSTEGLTEIGARL